MAMLKSCLRAAAVAFFAVAAASAHAQTKIKISAATINNSLQKSYAFSRKASTSGPAANLPSSFTRPISFGNIPSTVEGVALGTIEMVNVASGFYVGLEPRYLVFDAPRGFSTTPNTP